MEPTPISRRAALRLLLGAGTLALLPDTHALAITQGDIDKTEAELAETQQKYDEVEAQLEEIATQYEALSQELAETLANIDDVNAQIVDTESQIEEKEQELTNKRDCLSRRMRSAYKAGGEGAVTALLSSNSLEEFESNVYYLDKITENDRQLIEDVERLKAELEQHRADLEEERGQLEALRATQEEQLSQMQAKQEEVQVILEGLDEDVQELIAKRDEEILQLAREREEQKKREEEARKAAEEAARKAAEEAASKTTSDTSSSGAQDTTPSVIYEDGTTTGSQARIVASCKSTGSPGSGLCAMWVSMVFSNAGYPYAGGNANDMYNAWTTSSNRADLKPGMIVAVSTHSHTSAGRIYGHIGIYIGGGMMMDNIGYIRTISVNEWIRFYSTTVTPRWGWLMGIALAE